MSPYHKDLSTLNFFVLCLIVVIKENVISLINFTYNHCIGYTKPKYTQQGTAAAYVIYVSLEVEENPTKRKTNPFLLGEETWRMKFFFLITFEICFNWLLFIVFGVDLNIVCLFMACDWTIYKLIKRCFYIFSHVCCYQSVCQLSLLFVFVFFLGKRK